MTNGNPTMIQQQINNNTTVEQTYDGRTRYNDTTVNDNDDEETMWRSIGWILLINWLYFINSLDLIVVQTCHCLPSMILLLLSLVKFDCCIIISSLALILPRWYSIPWSQIIYVVLPRWYSPLSSLNDTSHYLPSMILLYLVELAHIFISTRFLFCSPHYFNSCLFALPPPNNSSWVAFNDCPCLSSTPPSLIQSNNRLSFFPHHRTMTGACGNSKECAPSSAKPEKKVETKPTAAAPTAKAPETKPTAVAPPAKAPEAKPTAAAPGYWGQARRKACGNKAHGNQARCCSRCCQGHWC